MKKDSPGKKRPYLAPSAKKLNIEQAKQFLTVHTNHSAREATAILESLQQEMQSPKEKDKAFINA